MKRAFKVAATKPDSGPEVAALFGRSASRDAAAREALEQFAQEANTEISWTLAGHAFLAEAASVGAARSYVRTQLASWGVVDHAEDVDVCVSELATNAVQHAGGAGAGFLVAASRERDRVRVAVLDTSHRAPQLRRSSVDDLSGRGLQLVDGLADRWGHAVNLLGKTVWAEFDLATPPPRSGTRGGTQ